MDETPKPIEWYEWDINQKEDWLRSLEKRTESDEMLLNRLESDTDKDGSKATKWDTKKIADFFNVSEDIFHYRIKKKIIRDHRELVEMRLRGCNNPDVLVSEKNHIVLEKRNDKPKPRVNSGTPAELYQEN